MSAKKRTYEFIYLVHRDATDDDLSELEARLTGIITDEFSGTVFKKESWGKRRLAYEIKKGVDVFSKAFYEYLVFEGIPGVTQEIERVLRLNEQCIRFMAIKINGYEAPVAEEAEETAAEA
jgi:small subunit ribosomal protein S6